jgi:hypothetical protein
VHLLRVRDRLGPSQPGDILPGATFLFNGGHRQCKSRVVKWFNKRLLIGIPVLRLQLVAILLHKAEDVSRASLLFFSSAPSLTSFYGNNR